METVLSRLRAWRSQKARELSVPSYIILANAHLAGVAAASPATLEELAECRGLGPKRLSQYGNELLSLVHRCLTEGLPTGVEWPEPQVEGAEPGKATASETLSAEELLAINAALRSHLANQLTRKFKGRFTASQVETALSRLHLPA